MRMQVMHECRVVDDGIDSAFQGYHEAAQQHGCPILVVRHQYVWILPSSPKQTGDSELKLAARLTPIALTC
eukprot:1145320-Pelagomonas_calceolata.AAC.7